VYDGPSPLLRCSGSLGVFSPVAARVAPCSNGASRTPPPGLGSVYLRRVVDHHAVCRQGIMPGPTSRCNARRRRYSQRDELQSGALLLLLLTDILIICLPHAVRLSPPALSSISPSPPCAQCRLLYQRSGSFSMSCCRSRRSSVLKKKVHARPFCVDTDPEFAALCQREDATIRRKRHGCAPFRCGTRGLNVLFPSARALRICV
jgi:hypothetical protein